MTSLAGASNTGTNRHLKMSTVSEIDSVSECDISAQVEGDIFSGTGHVCGADAEECSQEIHVRRDSTEMLL